MDLCLFPAEDSESDSVDDYGPEADEAELRHDIDEMGAFGGDEANTVDNRGERQEV